MLALPRLRAMVELLPPTRLPRVPVIVRVEPERAKEEVATAWTLPVPEPYMSEPEESVVEPVPPLATVRALARVSWLKIVWSR